MPWGSEEVAKVPPHGWDLAPPTSALSVHSEEVPSVKQTLSLLVPSSWASNPGKWDLWVSGASKWPVWEMCSSSPDVLRHWNTGIMRERCHWCRGSTLMAISWHLTPLLMVRQVWCLPRSLGVDSCMGNHLGHHTETLDDSVHPTAVVTWYGQVQPNFS